MVSFADMTDEERIRRLEHRVAETRKMLFGALLLAKEIWGEELSRRPDGLDILDAIEKAEESFTAGPRPERFTRFELAIDVIDQRAKALFELMTYISKYKQHE